jgi:hypothetical protein
MKKFKDLKPTRVFESLWRFAAERHAICAKDGFEMSRRRGQATRPSEV